MDNNTLSSVKKPDSPRDSSLHGKTSTHTRVNVAKVEHTWTISNFSYLSQEADEKLTSQIFSTAANHYAKWQLELYPRGNKTPEFVSLYLRLLNICNDSAIKAEVKFVIYNDKMEEGVSLKLHQVYTKSSTDWGFAKFVKRDYLLDVANNLLPNNALTVYCECTFGGDKISVSQMYRPPFQNSTSNRSKNLRLMYEEQELADVTFVVSGQTFSAHKAILASFSPVFLAMFATDMEESKKNCIDIVDMDQETLQEMLRFIYTGEACNIEKLAGRLLFAADKYALDELKYICEEQLYKSLVVENAWGTLILADLHNSDWLKAVTMNFITGRTHAVMETKDFKSMVNSHPHLLAEAMRALAIQNKSDSDQSLPKIEKKP